MPEGQVHFFLRIWSGALCMQVEARLYIVAQAMAGQFGSRKTWQHVHVSQLTRLMYCRSPIKTFVRLHRRPLERYRTETEGIPKLISSYLIVQF
jgi:hypothetical protein